MLNYILTDEAIVIPTGKEILQVSRGDKRFNRIAEILHREKTTLSEIMIIINRSFNYEDDEISFTQEKGSDEIEVFYNGKYFTLDNRLALEIKTLLEMDDGFRIEYGVKFIKKLLDARIPFNYLLSSLFEQGFSFTSDGNIVTVKSGESKTEVPGHYIRNRRLQNDDYALYNYIVIEPKYLFRDDDDNICYSEYHVIGTIMGGLHKVKPFLKGTYVGISDSLIELHDLVVNREITDELESFLGKHYGLERIKSFTDKITMIESFSRKLEELGVPMDTIFAS